MEISHKRELVCYALMFVQCKIYVMIRWLKLQSMYMRSDKKLHYQDVVLDDATNV